MHARIYGVCYGCKYFCTCKGGKTSAVVVFVLVSNGLFDRNSAVVTLCTSFFKAATSSSKRVLYGKPCLVESISHCFSFQFLHV